MSAQRPGRSRWHGDRARWDVAGLVGPSGSLHTPSPVPASKLVVPASIEVVDERLVYRFGDRPRRVTPGPGLLDDFVELFRAPESKIVEYARRWGVFGNVCHDHLLPAAHREESCYPLAAEPGSEPLDFWRCWSWQARAMLNIASRLHRNERGDREDWAAILWWAYQTDPKQDRWRALSEQAQRTELLKNTEYFGRTVGIQRDALAAVVSSWLYHSNVRPWLGWETERPSLVLDAGGRLYGVLGLQLALAVSRADALTTCESCSRPFLKRHKPGRSRKYCDSAGCGTRARWRLAQARYAAKPHEKRERPRTAAKGAHHG